MTKVSHSIINSDWDTLRNDDKNTTSVTIPGSVSVPGSGILYWQSDIIVGKSQSLLNSMIRSSKEGSKYFAGNFQIRLDRTGTASGSPASYNIYVYAIHLSGNLVRCQAFISNPYSVTLTGAAGDETFTFLVKSFETPSFS